MGHPLSVQVLPWGEDIDSAEWVEYEQILIAGKDHAGVTRQCQSEKLVILWIATSRDGRYALDV